MMAKSDWKDQVFTSFQREAAQIIQDRISPHDVIYRKCESPIETAFAVAFDLVHGLWRGGANHSSTLWVSDAAPAIFLEPQYQIGSYRVDFLCGWNIGDHVFTSIAIECDGHDFHEKTKQQAARDKARDRELSESVARVLRFTGSEIYRDPCKCATEALGLADQLFWAWDERGRAR